MADADRTELNDRLAPAEIAVARKTGTPWGYLPGRLKNNYLFQT
jgi:hypothetical protein